MNKEDMMVERKVKKKLEAIYEQVKSEKNLRVPKLQEDFNLSVGDDEGSPPCAFSDGSPNSRANKRPYSARARDATRANPNTPNSSFVRQRSNSESRLNKKTTPKRNHELSTPKTSPKSRRRAQPQEDFTEYVTKSSRRR